MRDPHVALVTRVKLVPLWPKPELPDGTAFSLVWRNGNALSSGAPLS